MIIYTLQHYFQHPKNHQIYYTQTNVSDTSHKHSDHQPSSFLSHISFSKQIQNPQNKFVQTKHKYKTQMCKNFSEKGYCNYKNKCQYAHGYDQLSWGVLACNKSYRTKKCKSFWQNGVCTYGIRCQFSHYEISVQSRLFLKINLDLMNKDEKNKDCGLFRILEKE